MTWRVSHCSNDAELCNIQVLVAHINSKYVFQEASAEVIHRLNDFLSMGDTFLLLLFLYHNSFSDLLFR